MNITTLRIGCSNCNLREVCMPLGLTLKDMETVEAQSEDRALDMEPHVDEAGNSYDYGFGLNYGGVIKS